MANEIDNKKLLAEVERLKAELAEERGARTAAEESALAMVASGFAGQARDNARPTGRTITVKVAVNPNVRDEKKIVWKDVELPTYFYKINLPASFGWSLDTNGTKYYHGQTYEFDTNTLTDMKSRVARAWEHEESIHGNKDENFYRQKREDRV